MPMEPACRSKPVARLFELGAVAFCSRPPEWLDYVALGIEPEHVPELIQVACDMDLHQSQQESIPWVPLHAWRALGQLAAVEALGPMMKLAVELDRLNDDWFTEDFPYVWAMMGLPAMEPLGTALLNPDLEWIPRMLASSALCKIAEQHAEQRSRVLEYYAQSLAAPRSNPTMLNGAIIGDVLELKGVELAEAIERAYAAHAVDAMVAGNWQDVKQELGVPGIGLIFSEPTYSRPMPSLPMRRPYLLTQREQALSRKKKRRRR